MANIGKVIKCKAAVCWNVNEPLKIETIDVAPPKSHEVRVKIIATGICHTDLSAWNGSNKMITFPVILGHEGAGIVESIGTDVKNFAIGDKVIPVYVAQCNNCVNCKSSKTNVCEQSTFSRCPGVCDDGTTRYTCNGKPIYHFMGTSTFSEYIVISDVSLVKINNKAPLEKVCLLGCGIPTGYGAAINTAKVTKGSSCAIWGLGAVGLAAVMGCKNAGASKIIGIDINPNKKQKAEEFGCTEFINPLDFPDKPLTEILMEKTNGGLDFTFECIGNVETIVTALESTHSTTGVAIVVGVVPTYAKITISPMQFLLGRTLTGSVFGGFKSVDEVPKLVTEYLNGNIKLDEFITHKKSINSINEALELLKTGECIRTIINFD